jgi:three-Cys-motif partner protein
LTGEQLLSDTRHEFGGPWTEVKLDAIDAYAHYFTAVLKNQPFELWYIDGFAGTGSRNAKKEIGGLFEGEPAGVIEEVLAGSAKRALAVQPPFHHLVLIDQKAKHYRALCDLAKEHPQRDVRVLRGDANELVVDIVTAPPWTKGHPRARFQRALIFLDPYDMAVRWPTLEVLAASQRADVWFLANLKAAIQQLAHDHGALDDSKRAALSGFFGTMAWEDEFYRFREGERDLFSDQAAAVGHRAASREEIAGFYRKRLETLFSYVSRPLGLRVKNQDDYFQLYCMSNNPSPSARALIHKGADHVIRKHGQAFRRMSAL